MSLSYKGYRIGTIEKGLLQLFLKIKKNELPYQNSYDPTYADIFKTARQKAGFSRTFQQLKEKGLIQFQNKDGRVTAFLTDKGKIFIDGIDLKKINIIENKKWDNKWRVVIFDIPQKRRIARDLLRDRLKEFGFKQIQASVWTYPYECESIVALIKTSFELGDEVIYMIVESIEGDFNLRKKFKLS